MFFAFLDASFQDGTAVALFGILNSQRVVHGIVTETMIHKQKAITAKWFFTISGWMPRRGWKRYENINFFCSIWWFSCDDVSLDDVDDFRTNRV